MATASAGRAARGCREAPARSARPCSTTASRFPGRAGAKPIKWQKNLLLRSKSEEADMNSHSELEEPRTAAELIARYRDVRRRLYSPATLPKLGSSETDHAARKAIATIPNPPASPNHGRLKPRFNIKLPLAKPFKQFRPEPACRSPTSSAATGGRRSPQLVTRRFGACAWRRAGHCRAWDGSSNATTRPCCTRSARWRSARPAIPNCSPT
jgi:hypothetical protein